MLIDTSTIDLTYDDVNDTISGEVKLNSITNNMLSGNIDASKIDGGIVSNGEFNQLNGVTSNIQQQLDGKESVGVANTLMTNHIAASDPHQQYALDSDLTSKIDISQKGVANGVGIHNIHLPYSNIFLISAGSCFLAANAISALFDINIDILVSPFNS